MATSPRAAILNKAHTVLKKHYKVIAPQDRPVLEQLIYASCLEDASFQAADQAFEALNTVFHDWNEVRVCAVRDLAEAMPMLRNPPRAGENILKILQSRFETSYSFDLEPLRKLNLTKAVHCLEEIPGTTRFSVAYVTQTSFGGHAIAVDEITLDLLTLISPDGDRDTASIGLERSIPKAKGPEFFSLLHQFAADLADRPEEAKLKKLVLEINPDAQDRLGPSDVAEETPTQKKKANKKKTAKTKKAAAENPSPSSKKKAPAKRKPR